MPYSEKLEIGYRWYDAQGIEPLFPFGHGLSYSTFDYYGLRVDRDCGEVRFKLHNRSARNGTEVAQVYLSLPRSTGEPPKRLVAWERVALRAGEVKEITLRIDPERLAYWDSARAGWKVAPGNYGVMVGASSRDIRQQAAIFRR